MTVDTSREAAEDLIEECRDVGVASPWFTEVADTLAALLDERDGAVRLRLTINGRLVQRIRELEAALAKEREIHESAEAQKDSQVRFWADNAKKAESRAKRAEAERDHLAVELAQVTQCRDEYGNEIDVVNTRWERAEVERDKLAAKLDAVTAQRFHEAYERLAPEFGYRTREASAVPWADVPEQNKRLMEATVAAILADTDERAKP